MKKTLLLYVETELLKQEKNVMERQVAQVAAL
jgi:hypothetical protein